MAFDFDKLETAEGRGKFNKMMEELNLSHVNLGTYLVENSYEDKLSQLMLAKTKAIVRLYMVEGFDFA